PSESKSAGTPMLNTLTQAHEYPGKLFVVEGIDGSGKSTQLDLLAKWLSAEGHRVFVTEWNSSALVKAATKAGKKKNALTPMTFSLLHGKVLDEYDEIVKEFGLEVVDARPSITEQQRIVRALVAKQVSTSHVEIIDDESVV